jgi:hypothetical protein
MGSWARERPGFNRRLPTRNSEELSVSTLLARGHCPFVGSASPEGSYLMGVHKDKICLSFMSYIRE